MSERRCHGITANFRPWSAAEIEAVKTRYYTDGPRALAAELGRSITSIRQKASRLETPRLKRRWSKKDDAQLRDLWGTTSTKHVARALGRTPATTYWRARKLGLPCGAMGSFEYLSRAAQRTGFDTTTLRGILRRAGVELMVSASRPTRATRHYHVVDPIDVDWAVEQWLTTEPVKVAAERHGTSCCTLRVWLREARAAGFDVPAEPRKKAMWRVPSELADRVVAWKRSFESLSKAADRVGVDRVTLRNWLLEAGAPRTKVKPWMLETATVDRVVAERRARAEGRKAA